MIFSFIIQNPSLVLKRKIQNQPSILLGFFSSKALKGFSVLVRILQEEISKGLTRLFIFMKSIWLLKSRDPVVSSLGFFSQVEECLVPCNLGAQLRSYYTCWLLLYKRGEFVIPSNLLIWIPRQKGGFCLGYSRSRSSIWISLPNRVLNVQSG